MSTNNGGPAFPQPFLTQEGGDIISSVDFSEEGMSLRDYFAAKCLQGLLAAGGGVVRTAKDWAEVAYTLADAMLEARKK